MEGRKEGRQAVEEEEVKSCREWRRVTHAHRPPSLLPPLSLPPSLPLGPRPLARSLARSQIGNVVKCVTDA